MEQISLVQELVSNKSRHTHVSRKQDYKIVVEFQKGRQLKPSSVWKDNIKI